MFIVIRGIAFALLALAAVPCVHAAGLCKASEATVFNCETKETHKFVSLCSSKAVTENTGFLQYRYGVPGKVELAFPESLAMSPAQFGYDEYSRSDLSTYVVGFDRGGYRYELSETTEGAGDDSTTARALIVSSAVNKRSLRLTCLDNRDTISNLSTLDHVLKCDRQHEIVEGACE